MRKEIVLLVVVLLYSPYAHSLTGYGTESEPYLIQSLADFYEFAGDSSYWADGVYTCLETDIDLAGRTYTTAVIAKDMNDSNGWTFDGMPFSGVFDGNGYRILNLTIDTEGVDKNYLGLFGQNSTDALVANLGIENVNLTASGNWANEDYTGDFGALVGNNSGSIQNCWGSGSVTGGNYSEDIGGLCGYNKVSGFVTGCYVTGTVAGGANSGGIGGLCGSNDGIISNCWAGNFVAGRNSLGGLCGYIDGGSITNCYSTGEVNGTAGDIGGLYGELDSGIINNCFWDTETSGIDDPEAGQPDTDGVIGQTTTEMQTQSSFTDYGWDFVGEDVNGTNDIWRMCVDGIDYPRLSHEYSINGDFACPDRVGTDDLLALTNNWLNTEELDPGFNFPCDPTFDGLTNLADFVILAEHWLQN